MHSTLMNSGDEGNVSGRSDGLVPPGPGWVYGVFVGTCSNFCIKAATQNLSDLLQPSILLANC